MHVEEHLRKGDGNLDAYRALAYLNPPFHDWRIIILYYAAMHYVDAYLATRNVHPDSHADRKREMREVRELDPIYDIYRTIENSSRDARYEAVPFTPQDVAEIDRRVRQVDSHICDLLRIPAPVH